MAITALSPTGTSEEALARRSTREVFEDHLRLRAEGHLEEDLRRNYADDVLLLTENSVLHGHDALRISTRRLADQLPYARFDFTARQVAGEYAFLVWSAASDRCQVHCGADTFVIRSGKIRMHSLHYRLLGHDDGGS